MAAGDIVKEALLVVEKVLVKSNEDIELGEVIYNDGNGFLAAPNTVDEEQFYISLEEHDYSAESEHYIKALLMGCVMVQKVAGAIKEGQKVMISSTAGAVTVYSGPDAPTGGVSTYYTTAIESGVQTALDADALLVGTCAGDAASGDTTVAVWIGVK